MHLHPLKKLTLTAACISIVSLFQFASCKYSFNDVSALPPEVKTFRVNYFENKAPYINSQLSPQLTEKLKQKIINTTRLRQTNGDEAHYEISGYISQYATSTISITGANSSGNRLTLGFHLSFKNRLDEKKNMETDIVRTFDYSANLTLSQAEAALNEDMIRNLTDEIFNKIFSNW
jgi:hypothetical protein